MTVDTDTAGLLDKLRAALEPVPGIQIALVFGSAAVGRLTPSSDLDLAVAMDKPLTDEDREAVIDRTSAASGRDVDLIDLHRAHGLILREAICRGRVLFCRDRTLHAGLMQRMWGEQADFQPVVDRLIHHRLAPWILR